MRSTSEKEGRQTSRGGVNKYMAALAVCLRLRQVDLDFAPEEANTATQPFPAGQSVVPSVSLVVTPGR